jgi:hypothetical protein
MKLTTKLIFFMLAFRFLFSGDITLAQCTNCLHSISDPQLASSSIGDRTKAIGHAAFASGFYAIASGETSTSIGRHSNADGALSFTFGSNASSIAEKAMIIGHGFGISSQDRLINNKSNSLMVGFNSIYPTLFISQSNSRLSTGKVGIGNITEPQAKLHIKADRNEAASLFIEQEDFRNVDLWMGNTNHGIRISDDYGMVLRSEKNFIFNEGNIGIGTAYPTHELDVQGSTFTKSLTLYDQDLYKTSIEGYILRSDAEGRAQWVSPEAFEDHDWTTSGDNIFRVKGKIGIGTDNPGAQLDIADIYPAGGMNLKVGNDAYLTDIDQAHALGIFSQNEPQKGALKLGSSGPKLFGINGKLGIGTNSPATTLELYSNLNNGGNVGLSLGNGSNSKWFIGMNGDQKSTNDLLIGGFNNIYQGYASLLVIKPNGNIGMGTEDTYGYKLAVNGAIITEEVTVKVHENWPDYVFHESHDLMPLDKLNSYINVNRHLPGIPSAAEISRDGLKVGAMEALLLEKIEELTLYIIQQDRKIVEMESKIEQYIY